MGINEKIKKLSKDEYLKFRKRLEDNLYNRSWCFFHRIDYTDPDIQKAKEECFKELFPNRR